MLDVPVNVQRCPLGCGCNVQVPSSVRWARKQHLADDFPCTILDLVRGFVPARRLHAVCDACNLVFASHSVRRRDGLVGTHLQPFAPFNFCTDHAILYRLGNLLFHH